MTIVGRSRKPSWTCEHCGAEVFLPNKVTEPVLYAEGVHWIREHRFGHLVDMVMNASDEELWAMSGKDIDLGEPITNEDAKPAVAAVVSMLKAILPMQQRALRIEREAEGKETDNEGH